MGSINILSNSCTTRSLIVGIPRGRFSLFPGLGIQIRRTGIGLYSPDFSSRCRFMVNLACFLAESRSLLLIPSIPDVLAPVFASVFVSAVLIQSSRHRRCHRSWNRCSGLACALRAKLLCVLRMSFTDWSIRLQNLLSSRCFLSFSFTTAVLRHTCRATGFVVVGFPNLRLL